MNMVLLARQLLSGLSACFFLFCFQAILTALFNYFFLFCVFPVADSPSHKGALMSVVFKEGLNIKPPALDQIIMGANNDVRQVSST